MPDGIEKADVEEKESTDIDKQYQTDAATRDTSEENETTNRETTRVVQSAGTTPIDQSVIPEDLTAVTTDDTGKKGIAANEDTTKDKSEAATGGNDKEDKPESADGVTAEDTGYSERPKSRKPHPAPGSRDDGNISRREKRDSVDENHSDRVTRSVNPSRSKGDKNNKSIQKRAELNREQEVNAILNKASGKSDKPKPSAEKQDSATNNAYTEVNIHKRNEGGKESNTGRRKNDFLIPCRYFFNSECRFGSRCRFSHNSTDYEEYRKKQKSDYEEYKKNVKSNLSKEWSDKQQTHFASKATNSHQHSSLPTNISTNYPSQLSQSQNSNHPNTSKSAVSTSHRTDMCPTSTPTITSISEGIKEYWKKQQSEYEEYKKNLKSNSSEEWSDKQPTHSASRASDITLQSPLPQETQVMRGLPNLTGHTCYLNAAIHVLALTYKPPLKVNATYHNLLEDVRNCLCSQDDNGRNRSVARQITRLTDVEFKDLFHSSQDDDATTVMSELLSKLKEEFLEAAGEQTEHAPYEVAVRRTFHCTNCESPTTYIDTLSSITLHLDYNINTNHSHINLQNAIDSTVCFNKYRVGECNTCGLRREGAVTCNPVDNNPKMIILQIYRLVEGRRLTTPIDTTNLSITLSGKRYTLQGCCTHVAKRNHWLTAMIGPGRESTVLDDEVITTYDAQETYNLISQASVLVFKPNDDTAKKGKTANEDTTKDKAVSAVTNEDQTDTANEDSNYSSRQMGSETSRDQRRGVVTITNKASVESDKLKLPVEKPDAVINKAQKEVYLDERNDDEKERITGRIKKDHHTPCRYYFQSVCRFGRQCRFSHNSTDYEEYRKKQKTDYDEYKKKQKSKLSEERSDEQRTQFALKDLNLYRDVTDTGTPAEKLNFLGTSSILEKGEHTPNHESTTLAYQSETEAGLKIPCKGYSKADSSHSEPEKYKHANPEQAKIPGVSYQSKSFGATINVYPERKQPETPNLFSKVKRSENITGNTRKRDFRSPDEPRCSTDELATIILEAMISDEQLPTQSNDKLPLISNKTEKLLQDITQLEINTSLPESRLYQRRDSIAVSNKRHYEDRDQPNHEMNTLCWWHKRGRCKYGNRCWYYHPQQDEKPQEWTDHHQQPFREEA